VNGNKCACLKYCASVDVIEKCKVDRHFMSLHKDYTSKYYNSEICRYKVEDFNLICNRVKQCFLNRSLFIHPKALSFCSIKPQKTWLRRRSRLKMVRCLKRVYLWQAIHYSSNLKIKVKYAVELRSSSTVTRKLECMPNDTEQQLRKILKYV
jgi:hypothetical protein